MGRLCDGDEDALSKLMERYRPAMTRFLTHRLNGHHELAEEAFLQVFSQVWIRGSQYNRGAKVSGYLYAIASNAAVDVSRREKRHGRKVRLYGAEDEDRNFDIPVEPDTWMERMILAEDRAQMQSLLLQLPSDQWECVRRVYFEDMKYNEVAADLRIPIGTVKSRLHAAIVRLHDTYDRKDINDNPRSAPRSGDRVRAAPRERPDRAACAPAAHPSHLRIAQ